jgi:dGTPase
VRRFGRPLADFSPPMKERHAQLRRFLLQRVYRHPIVVGMQSKAERFVTRLFELYADNPAQLPRKYQDRIPQDGLKTVITDYISGMTDNYCMEEYIRAFEPTMGRRGWVRA